MIKRILKVVYFLFLLIIFSSFVSASVQVFSTYDTNISINSNKTLDVHKHIVLKNIHTVGIVPGRVEFKIAKLAEGSVSEIELDNFEVIDRYGNGIRNEVFNTADGTTIALDIYRPLLPGFEYSVDVYYTISFDSSGLFFKNMQIPIKDATSVPVQGGEFNLVIPERYSFTYISGSENATVVQSNRVSFDIGNTNVESIHIEYSYLPVKIGNFKGSYVFWIFVNIVLLIVLTVEIRKEVRKMKSDTHHHKKSKYKHK